MKRALFVCMFVALCSANLYAENSNESGDSEIMKALLYIESPVVLTPHFTDDVVAVSIGERNQTAQNIFMNAFDIVVFSLFANVRQRFYRYDINIKLSDGLVKSFENCDMYLCPGPRLIHINRGCVSKDKSAELYNYMTDPDFYYYK